MTSLSLSLSLSCIGEGNGSPLQCSCLENPRDGGAWWAAVLGVAQSRTWLKRLSSSVGLFTGCQFCSTDLCVCFLYECYQFSSLSRVRLWNPMDCSTPGLLVHHQLPELAQTHVHWVSDAIQPSHPVFPFSSCLQSFPASGSFPMSQFFPPSGQSIVVSASASILPMNIHNWFPLGLTGLVLQSKGLSRVFSNTTVQKHPFFGG